eukprot:GHVP01068758.1.p1 GENE.GHVP01068758.1~~GHVP01068758.1.p1  ORF type:complete len:335 (+),score=71.15 GHVP01068758.1:36-1040(+)
MSGPYVCWGYLEDYKAENHIRLHRCRFPSKAGGKPAWLCPTLPSEESLKCVVCKNLMNFVLQLYIPGENDNCFHRTFFVFGCQNCGEGFSCFRSQLPQINKYYPAEALPDDTKLPEDEWLKDGVCAECGLPFCPETSVEEKLHQRCIRQLHKTALTRFSEYEILDEEELSSESSDEEEEKENKYRVLNEDLKDMDESERDAFESLVKEAKGCGDKSFIKLLESHRRNPGQVLRVSEGHTPMWAADTNQIDLSDIPPCGKCGAARQFVFQIHPSIIFKLGEDLDPYKEEIGCRLDFGLLCVYSCSKDCDVEESYNEEIIYRQNEPDVCKRNNLPL